ncbi:MGMT family protein [Desulforhopalus vacuolatus]|uniref:MGMT family protein n=1 Tax=Desulforhopalus vacuolatus TaxID=40414 RepID=UPI001964B919|nr:MGMT family protein [Desulforhopalus vacuolatus]MBM9518313.1 MGMT family protein [Desulforhopalus vacuolatus]
MKQFSSQAICLLQKIPAGRVATYGDIATLAGNPRGARQVSRLLSSSAGKYNLPWHRVVNREGKVSPRSSGEHLWQRQLLEEEGIVFDAGGCIDFTRFGWDGS